MHVNGGVYYHHATQRIITELDMSCRENRSTVMEDRKYVIDRCTEDGVMKHVPWNFEVVLLYGESDDSTEGSDSGEGIELQQVFFISHDSVTEVKHRSYGAG